MFKHATRTLIAIGIAAGLGLGSAQAATLTQGIVPGPFNLLQDESREAYVDTNSDGRFGVGDVIIGYFRLSDFSPSGLAANNQVYAVFSQQVTAINFGASTASITFGATTTAGLTLSTLTGSAQPAGGIFAMYDRATPYTDLINTGLGAGQTMKDYIDYITGNGTLELVGGFGGTAGGSGEFLVSSSDLLNAAGGFNNVFVGLPTTVTIASTGAALSVLVNNLPFTFANDVFSNSPSGFSPFLLSNSQLGVSSGSVAGTGSPAGPATPLPQDWMDASGYGAFTQCTILVDEVLTSVPCGFIDKNDFGIHPLAVPEPSSLLLLSVALVAAGGVARRRKV